MKLQSGFIQFQVVVHLQGLVLQKCSNKMNFIYNPIHCLLENNGCNTKPCRWTTTWNWM